MGLDQPIWLVKMLQFTVIFLVSINQPGGKKVIYDYQSSFLLVIQVTVTCWNLVKFHFMLVNSLLLGTSPFSSAKSSSLPNSHVLWPNSAFSLAKNHPKKKTVLRCFKLPAPECSAGPRTANRHPSPARNSDAEPPRRLERHNGAPLWTTPHRMFTRMIHMVMGQNPGTLGILK